MNLVQTAEGRLGIDADRATKGVGTLFVAIRMAVDMKTFSQIASAFPDCGLWMLKAPFENAGTGESVQKVFSLGNSSCSFSATRLIRKLPRLMPRRPGWQFDIE